MITCIQSIPTKASRCISSMQRPICLYMTEDGNQNINKEEHDESDSSGEKEKNLSPLAMAAAEWLEDEEDELTMYWDRFDFARGCDKSRTDDNNTVQNKQEVNTQSSSSINFRETTEQRLDRYYEKCGIDKGEERKYAPLIHKAVESAKKAPSAEEALKLLEPIRQYLQFNTKIGGNAYFEIAQALDAIGDQESATVVYQQLADSPHADVRKKSRELLASSTHRPKRVYKKNVWSFFWDEFN